MTTRNKSAYKKMHWYPSRALVMSHVAQNSDQVIQGRLTAATAATLKIPARPTDATAPGRAAPTTVDLLVKPTYCGGELAVHDSWARTGRKD